LVGASVVQPLVYGGGLPDRVEMHSDSIRGGNNSSCDDFVSIEKGSGDGFSDSVDVDGGRCGEGGDNARGGRQQGGEHDGPEPSDVESVYGASDPVGESFPGGKIALLLQVGGRERRRVPIYGSVF